MMFLMQLPLPVASRSSVHPRPPCALLCPVMCCAELAALLVPIPEVLRVSADFFP